MKHEEYALLAAVGNLLEYRSGPDGQRAFVREPLYNVAKCFSEYVGSMDDGREKEILERLNKYAKMVSEQRSHLYLSESTFAKTPIS